MRQYLIVTVILLGILIVGVTAKLRLRVEPVALVAAPTFQIENETESLQIVKSVLEGGNLVMTIKNTGRKSVVAYRIAINPKEEMMNDFDDQDSPLSWKLRDRLYCLSIVGEDQ